MTAIKRGGSSHMNKLKLIRTIKELVKEAIIREGYVKRFIEQVAGILDVEFEEAWEYLDDVGFDDAKTLLDHPEDLKDNYAYWLHAMSYVGATD